MNETKNSVKNFQMPLLQYFVIVVLAFSAFLSPYLVLSQIRLTRDVLIGTIIVWAVVWTIPHLILSTLIFLQKRNGYVYSMFVSGFVVLLAFLYFPRFLLTEGIVIERLYLIVFLYSVWIVVKTRHIIL